MRNPLRRLIPGTETRWQLKQRAAEPGRYYGDGGTIHHTNYLDVETHNGYVVAVWFRCQVLPFRQTEVDEFRGNEMTSIDPRVSLTGVEVVDCERESPRMESV